MAYIIGEECISCGACEAECPVSCISAGDGKYEIDASQCIECGSCAYVCPARIPLVQQFRVAKMRVQEKRRAEAAAAKAAAENK